MQYINNGMPIRQAPYHRLPRSCLKMRHQSGDMTIVSELQALLDANALHEYRHS